MSITTPRTDTSRIPRIAVGSTPRDWAMGSISLTITMSSKLAVVKQYETAYVVTAIDVPTRKRADSVSGDFLLAWRSCD
jgi:hypothetical protein